MQVMWTGCRTSHSCSRTSSGPFKSLSAVQQRSHPLVRLLGEDLPHLLYRTVLHTTAALYMPMVAQIAFLALPPCLKPS